MDDRDRYTATARHAAQTGDSALWAHALIAAYGHPADPAYRVSCEVCAAAEKTAGRVNARPAKASK